jgi:beta-1,4-N-acetylglucosaminyltransferase
VKIFVTVGTTKFDSLIEAVDKNLDKNNYEIIFQIANGKYKPKNFEYFKFTQDVKMHFNNSDIIITHAGAGSIYELLELEKKIIIVPNLDRIDKHQSDIACFMDDNGYAKMLKSFEELEVVIKYVEKSNFKKFEKNNFFKVDEILEYIN